MRRIISNRLLDKTMNKLFASLRLIRIFGRECVFFNFNDPKEKEIGGAEFFGKSKVADVELTE